MPLVDSHGRLFGRINLIDAAVLLFIAVLIPLGYGAYALFHVPSPRLSAVVPNTLGFSRGVEQRVGLEGQHLRPFLRAKFGSVNATNYALLTADSAEIRFVDLPPGTFDLVLYDESHEVARLPGALTILPLPVLMTGSFDPSPAVDRLAPGVKLGTSDRPIDVLDVDRSGDRHRATLRVTCRVSAENQCLVGGVTVRPGTKLTLPVSGGTDRTTFQVNDLRIDREWVVAKVRLMGVSESLALAAPGQVDYRETAPPGEMAGVTSTAVLRSLGEVRKGVGTFAITASQPQTAAPDLSKFGVLSAVLPVDARDAEILVPAESSPAGLKYRDGLVRPGTLMHFDTTTYRLEAMILSVSKLDGAAQFPEPR
jgi:hypothetical protein